MIFPSEKLFENENYVKILVEEKEYLYNEINNYASNGNGTPTKKVYGQNQ